MAEHTEINKAVQEAVQNCKFKVNDRVKRINATGSIGSVKQVRAEVLQSAAADIKVREKALMVSVLWDNGTLSVFAPDALEHAGK